MLVSLSVCLSCKIFGELQDHLEGVGKPLVYNKIVVVFLGYIINIFKSSECKMWWCIWHCKSHKGLCGINRPKHRK